MSTNPPSTDLPSTPDILMLGRPSEPPRTPRVEPPEPGLLRIPDRLASTAEPTSAVADELAGPAEADGRYIWLLTLAQFGVFIAFITPLAISLAIRLDKLAPGQDHYLGYITGVGACVPLLTGAVLGQLSDRTRTRLGRRRPFMIAGVLVGVVSLVVMALAPNVLVLALGWMLAQLGWGQALGSLQISAAERLSESQRGKVSGLVGFATQIAPVLGVAIAGVLSGTSLLLFLVPGAVGVVLVALFVVLIPEPDSRGLVLGSPPTLGDLLRNQIFDPRQHRDYAWNWLGRFLFYAGLAFYSTFTAFLFADRLGKTVDDVAVTISIVALFGIVATTAGALGGGFLSDRLRRRRAFVLGSGLLFGTGSTIVALAPGLALLVPGALVASLGIGAFSAVDQALLLDVLPERETSAGRFMGITGLATSIPQALAPLAAPVLLMLGSGGAKNYTLLYIVAGLCTTAGGLVVLRIRSVR